MENIKYFLDIPSLLQSSNIDIMCETLHHLNDLHAKWLFDTYWAVPQPYLDECRFLSAQELEVYLHISRRRTKKV